MLKRISFVCLLIICLLLAVSLSGCSTAQNTPEPSALPAEESSNMPEETPVTPASPDPKESRATNVGGYCVTVGEFYSELEALLTKEGSSFRLLDISTGDPYPILFMNSTETEEIRWVSYDIDGEYPACSISAILKGHEGFPGDDERFDNVIAYSTLSTYDDFRCFATVASAIIYLTQPDINDFAEAYDYFSDLMEYDGDWKIDAALEYNYANATGDIYTFCVRERAPYK